MGIAGSGSSTDARRGELCDEIGGHPRKQLLRWGDHLSISAVAGAEL